MNKKSNKLIVSLILMMIMSCNEPETIVTDYVHTDGSVTRKVEMKSNESDVKKRFKISDIQIPFDRTWNVRDSLGINTKGDTTWFRKAEKLFKNVGDINLTYVADSGCNKEISRHAGFKRSFKWFNTGFRFSETIDRKSSFGYPVSNFLNKEELLYFYSPESIKKEKEAGRDSLKFRALSDSVRRKTDKWTARNIVSEWIGEFSRLTGYKTDSGMSVQTLKSRETEFANIIEKDDKELDSLWKNGIILKEFIGEANAMKYGSEADSALSIVTGNFLVNFSDYSLRIVMPGKLFGTNGFMDSSQTLLWPVKADYFLTEPYEMRAESKVPNKWAWIVSGFFLVFVLTGVIIRVIKKG